MNNLTNHLNSHDRSHRVDDRIRARVSTATVLQGGENLFKMGDELDGLYIVNAGFFKLSRNSECGLQQIIGFYMSGDIIGLDALSDGVCHSTATALDTASVSAIPYLDILTGNKRFSRRELLKRIGAALTQSNKLMMMLSQGAADQRIAWFLSEYSDRLVRQGMVADEFYLPMPRNDIALFLGLAVETVCRELSQLAERGIIFKKRRQIGILQHQALHDVAKGKMLTH